MVNSTLVIGSNTVTFRGNDRYSLQWGLYKFTELAYPSGRGALGSGGHSKTKMNIIGKMVTDVSDGSADLQVWSFLLPLCRDTQRAAVPATMTYAVGAGTIVLTGWVTQFKADRDAPKGEEIIDITFSFFIRDVPDISNLS